MDTRISSSCCFVFNFRALRDGKEERADVREEEASEVAPMARGDEELEIRNLANWVVSVFRASLGGERKQILISEGF